MNLVLVLVAFVGLLNAIVMYMHLLSHRRDVTAEVLRGLREPMWSIPSTWTGNSPIPADSPSPSSTPGGDE